MRAWYKAKFIELYGDSFTHLDSSDNTTKSLNKVEDLDLEEASLNALIQAIDAADFEGLWKLEIKLRKLRNVVSCHQTPHSTVELVNQFEDILL